jgi:hypothetical protein
VLNGGPFAMSGHAETSIVILCMLNFRA